MKKEMWKFVKFSKGERNEFWLTALIFGFILSFKEWGVTSFDWIAGVQNLLIATLIAALGLYVHHFFQRYHGFKMGYKVEHKLWWFGLLGGLLIAFVTNGMLPILIASGAYIGVIKARRIGKYFEGPNTKDFAKIAFSGPFACLILAATAKFFELWFAPGSELFLKIVAFNALFGLENMLPLPPLDGSRILFGSRLGYATLFGFVFGFLVALYAAGAGIIASAAVGALLAVVCWWLMYFFAVK